MSAGGPRRICIIRLSALGDVCLVVPLVRVLQRNFPEAQITWVIGQAAHALVEGLDGVEFVVADKNKLLANWGRLRGRSFDALLAVQASLRAHMLLTAIHAPVRIGFDSTRAKDFHGWFVNQHIPPGEQHLLDSFLSFASVLGVQQPVIEWRLPISDADHAFAREHMPGENWLALNPMASKPERNWLPNRYAAVIDHVIQSRNWKVVFTGGPAADEAAFARNILGLVKQKAAVTNLVGKTTPKQLAAVLSLSRVLLAPDTGPVHIATAMGKPVIGLYAVAPSKLSGPYLSREFVIDRFPEAVRTILHKDPERVPWGTRVHTQKAMELIQVSDVLEKLKQV
ncbi:MAG TPA: glycosyltransferase family 9 protein [Candidatus Binatia bacterium]|nr:glycosyltransferase family 9 protein [Candidatus Binatia bacterium]